MLLSSWRRPEKKGSWLASFRASVTDLLKNLFSSLNYSSIIEMIVTTISTKKGVPGVRVLKAYAAS